MAAKTKTPISITTKNIDKVSLQIEWKRNIAMNTTHKLLFLLICCLVRIFTKFQLVIASNAWKTTKVNSRQDKNNFDNQLHTRIHQKIKRRKKRRHKWKTYCCFCKVALQIDPAADFPAYNPNGQSFLCRLIRHTWIHICKIKMYSGENCDRKFY